MQKFEILHGLPPYGPMAKSFGGHAFSEGLVVRFFHDSGKVWTGNFAGGGSNIGCNTVIEHPNQRDLIVVSTGQAYIINPNNQECLQELGMRIKTIMTVPELHAVILGDDCGFESIGQKGLLWKSKRIALDGIQNIKYEGLNITGQAFGIDQQWHPFVLDLKTGKFTGGDPSFVRQFMIHTWLKRFFIVFCLCLILYGLLRR